MNEAVASLRATAGLGQVAFAADFAGGATDLAQVRDSDMLVFNNLGVAVADAEPAQLSSAATLVAGESAILSIEPEPIFFAFGDGPPPDFLPYLRGYRDAVEHLYRKLTAGPSGALEEGLGAAAFQNTAAATWGLAAINALGSGLTGRGVKVAVLDTGLDTNHPDFRGRPVVSRSFVAGQPVDDNNGHGTHCVGAVCGPRQPGSGPRYGVAADVDLYVGKVLSNQGSSLGRSTLAGIEWAVTNE
jgi:subtilisin family serine protease